MRISLHLPWFLVAMLVLAGVTLSVAAPPDRCEVCGGVFGATLFHVTDGITKEKWWYCPACAELPNCYLCGIPVKDGFLTVSDGRLVCKRDRVGLVVEDAEALRICQDVDDTLKALLGRFTEFPTTNVQVRLLDRIDVRTMMGVAGHDVACPNLLGCTRSQQRPGHLLHEIRLLNGMQKGVLIERAGTGQREKLQLRKARR